MTNDFELKYWLALLRAPNLSYKAYHFILQRYAEPAVFFKSIPPDSELTLHPNTRTYLTSPNWKLVDSDLEWLAQSTTHRIVSFRDHAYPCLLREIALPPPILFVQGDASLLDRPQIAIVGSRKASPVGRKIAYEFAIQLGAAGLVVTSGLALGIDAAAHQGALVNHTTVAVVGTGIDQCYPAANYSLAQQIAHQGVIISQFPCETRPYAYNFPARNGLISGLSLGTLVIEADLKSGSLITAKHSIEQGREVFAVPGSIHNPKSRGCHYLLKQGAKLTESVADILEELSFLTATPAPATPSTTVFRDKGLDDDCVKLLECIDYEPTKNDLLVERSKLSIQKVTSSLVDLELAGYVCSTLAGYMRVS